SASAIRSGAEMPTLRKLMAEGSSTLEARSILPSNSAPNWSSMFMGAGNELHGYNTWGSTKPDFPAREIGRGGVFPNIFGVYRDSNSKAEIGIAYEWDVIRKLTDTTALNFSLFAPTSDTNQRGITDASVKYIKEKKPNLFVASFGDPDHTGHTYGWGSKEYMSRLTELDGYLSELLAAIKAAGIEDSSLVIVTADHGGKEKSHGSGSMEEMQIPIVIWGYGVKKNHQMTSSIMIYDIASTIISAKHLSQPQVWIGRPIWDGFALK
ncbi:MAG: alkaline phosphatase, partial [Rikenellaceae bacterium]